MKVIEETRDGQYLVKMTKDELATLVTGRPDPITLSKILKERQGELFDVHRTWNLINTVIGQFCLRDVLKELDQVAAKVKDINEFCKEFGSIDPYYKIENNGPGKNS
jgi:hypothetical protein